MSNSTNGMRSFFNINRHKSNPTGRLQPWTALGLVAALLLSVSLACEVGPTLKWVSTVSYMSPTPDLTQTLVAQLTATVMVGKVDKPIGNKQVLVILDPLVERNISGVNVKAVQLGSFILVETYDPLRRYLPDAEVVAVDHEPVQKVVAQQVDSGWKWNVKIGDQLDAQPLLGDPLGTMPLGGIDQFLASNVKSGGINIIIPVLDSYQDDQPFALFRTAGQHTFIMVPPDMLAGGSARLAAPAPTAINFNGFAIFSFEDVPADSLLIYIHNVQNASVGNYVGETGTDIPWAEQKVREISKGMPANYTAPNGITQPIVNALNFDVNFVNSTRLLGTTQKTEPCLKTEQLNKVIRQQPAPGKILDGMTKKVILTVCNLVASAKQYQTLMYISPTVTPSPTITMTPPPYPTSTGVPTITPTRTITTIPTKTKTVSASTQTAWASATIGKSTSQAGTATQKALTKIARAATKTKTMTRLPPTSTATPWYINDQFVTSPDGIDLNVWDITDTPTPTVRSWPRESRMHQELVGTGGDLALITKQACLFGRAEFKMQQVVTGSGIFRAGWSDPSGDNGIYIETDTTYPSYPDPAIDPSLHLNFTIMAAGAIATQTPVLLTSTNYHTFKIDWEIQDDNNIMGTLNVDNKLSKYNSVLKNPQPASRLNFLIRTKIDEFLDPTILASSTSMLEIDYVNIYSANCQ